MQRRISPPAQARWGSGDRRDRPSAIAKALFDQVDDRSAFIGTVVRHQPTRTLWNPTAHEIDDASQRGTDKESKTPPDVPAEQRLVEHDDGADRPQRRADPEAAVDRKIDA